MLRRLTLIAVLAIAACGSGSSSSTPAGSGAATSGTAITIKDFKFSPTPLNAKVGDTITVTNQDGTDHELKANDGSFDAGRFATGSKTFAVSKTGTFAYHCDVHDYMTGVIQVAGS
jgi:plastocyanin